MEIKSTLISLFAVFIILCAWSGVSHAVPFDKQEITLLEAIEKISKEYEIYFTFDMTLVADVKVEYEHATYGSAEAAIANILEDTDLKYKFYDQRFVILYKEDAEGLKSLKQMSHHLDGLISEGEKVVTSAPEKSLRTVPKLLTRSLSRTITPIAFSVEGTVTDQDGESLIGVNIQVKGTNKGTSTDLDGNFTLEDIDENAILVVSYVGYQTQDVAVAGKSTIKVLMLVDAQKLDELIVVGYGTVKKSDLTGSVERVNVKDFKSQSFTQLTEMLSGTVAGFTSNQGTSASGGSSMQIRGPNSLTAGTSPMIVLDGAIFNGSLADINPSDIETIDILKDASSAAIYGSKAGSGVVIITTTKGKVGAPTINFTTKMGLSEAANNLRPLNAEEYLKLRGDYYRTTTNDFEYYPRHYFTKPDKLPDNISIEEWRDYNQVAPKPDNTEEYLIRHLLFKEESDTYLRGEETNWYDLVMQKGLRQDYNVNISGGNENINYYWSLGYLDNEGIILGDQYSAVRSRLNLEFQITDWLSAGVNAQYSIRDEGATQARLSNVFQTSPLGIPYNEVGTLNIFAGGHPGENTINPLMYVYNEDRQRKINSFFASIFTQIDLPFGFNYKLSFQPRSSFLKDYRFYGDNHYKGFAEFIDGYGTRQNTESFEWALDNLIKWNRTIDIHSFDVTLLYNVEKLNTWNNNNSNQTFSPNLLLGYHALQFGNNPTINNNDTEATGDAIMARLNYSLLEKYLFTASIRRDGYSAFGLENPRATFPALAFAWQTSNEDFFNIDFISRLKVRLSWGVNGNRDIGIYSALANLRDKAWYDGSKVALGVYNNSLTNPGLRWERTESYNVGLDIGVFNNRVSVSLDYYDMNTSDLLMNRKLPEITGFSNILSNLGELGNRGFEMTLQTFNVNTSNLSWSSNLIFSFNRNKINRLFGDLGSYTILGEERNGELPDFSNKWFPGQAIDVIWDYETLGIWQSGEAAEAAEKGLLAGDFKVLDVDGDGKYIDVQDKRFIGHSNPRYRIGLRNELSFLQNFTASVFIRADLGHLSSYGPAFINGVLPFSKHNMGYPVPYWMPENPIDDYPRLDAGSRRGVYGGGINIYMPRSFVRIQDLALSYNLPKELTQRLAIKNMRIFCSIRNLYSFDNYPGFDPESGLNPMPRTFTLGADLSL